MVKILFFLKNILICGVRELVINKLPKFGEAILSLDEAKNAGIALAICEGLYPKGTKAFAESIFNSAAKYKGKRASKMGRLFFTSSLNILINNIFQ